MRNFQQKRGLRRVLESKVFLFLLGAVLLVFIWNLFILMGKLRETAKNEKLAEQKVSDLTEQKSQVSSEIQKLGTDEGVEDSIRQKFGLAKDGEGVVVIVDDKNSANASAESKGGFWSFFKNLFK
ncbi:MAG TPA: septum formation initiator family protein [Candidatus Paceibacterota bacterium]|nr:septum formation initiator family protein [Candidatus Paceibacterota bacterium]